MSWLIIYLVKVYKWLNSLKVGDEVYCTWGERMFFKAMRALDYEYAVEFYNQIEEKLR